MLTLEEAKEALGDVAKEHTDEEILEIRDTLDGLASILFDMWLEKKKKELNK